MRSINALHAKQASRASWVGLQVNKMDDPSIINADGTWSKERYDEIVSKLTPFLRSCGYNPKKDIIFLPMSGLLGQNIKDPAPTSACLWYKVGARFRRQLWQQSPAALPCQATLRLHIPSCMLCKSCKA